MTQSPHTTTDQIFFAVMELILQGGLSAVTLSSVCRRAGLSKGGLTHHYPSKESLVDAFIHRSVDECLGEIHQQLQPIAPGGGKRTQAFLDLILKDPAMCQPESSREIAAVMIALMQGPSNSHAEAFYQRLSAELRGDGVSAAVLDLVVTAIDGLWLQAAVLPVQRVARRAEKVRLQLRRLVDADVGKPTAKALVRKGAKSTRNPMGVSL